MEPGTLSSPRWYHRSQECVGWKYSEPWDDIVTVKLCHCPVAICLMCGNILYDPMICKKNYVLYCLCL